MYEENKQTLNVFVDEWQAGLGILRNVVAKPVYESSWMRLRRALRRVLGPRLCQSVSLESFRAAPMCFRFTLTKALYRSDSVFLSLFQICDCKALSIGNLCIYKLLEISVNLDFVFTYHLCCSDSRNIAHGYFPGRFPFSVGMNCTRMVLLHD